MNSEEKLQLVNEIREQIQQIQEDFFYTRDDQAFEHWVIRVIEGFEDDLCSETREVSGPNDGGIDGYLHEYDEDRNTRIFQMKYTTNNPFSSNYDSAILGSIESSINLLESADINDIINATLKSHIASFRDAIEENYNISYYFVIFGELTSGAITQFDLIRRNLKDKQIDLSLIDVNQLLDYHLQWLSKQREERISENIEIKIENDRIIETTINSYNSFIIVLKTKELSKLFKKYRYQLFDLNVRYALQPSNEAAKRMKETLLDNEEKQYFIAYNNGITIICDNCSYDEDTEKLSINSPQIVNGCQTTVTLSNNHVSLSDDVNILCRVITAIDEDFSLKIAENNNTQNKVDSKDLRANDRNQRAIQQRFESLSPSWKYLRKRGEWRKMSNTQKNVYRHDSNLQDSISKYLTDYSINSRKAENEDIAKHYLSFKGKPTSVRTNSKKLFQITNGFYREVFSESRSAEEYLFPYLLFMGIIEKKRKEFLQNQSNIDFDSLSEPDKLIYFGSSVVKFAKYHILGLIGELIKLKYPNYNKNVAQILLGGNISNIAEQLYSLAIKELEREIRRLNPANADLSGEFKKDEIYNRVIASLRLEISQDPNLLDFLP